jgi:uncharacterized DUF497 family protein
MGIQKIVAHPNFWGYNKYMKITFDPAKRRQTFDTRDLAFEDAALVFEGQTLDMVDDRFDYGEERIITRAVNFRSTVLTL